jgi:hypothetical protein
MIGGDQIEVQCGQVLHRQQVNRDRLEGLDDLDIPTADITGLNLVPVLFAFNTEIA